MTERHYTIMIVPGSRAKLLRVKVRRTVLLGVASVAVFGLFAAGLLPVIYYKAIERSRQVASLQQENEQLREASKEISNLKDRVTFFENKATKFAMMAGVQDLPSAQGGGGLRPDVSPDPAFVRDEIDDLKERSSVLSDSFTILERVYRDQSLLLASTPSIAPVKGMIAYGYSWRKDPFTGQPAFHTGLDIVAPKGTRVMSPADGIVTKASRETGYGNVVFLSHGNGVTTRYAHLDGFAVRVGQDVSRGNVLGYIGNTGRSLGAHLHYEVLVNNTKVDPTQYIIDERASY